MAWANHASSFDCNPLGDGSLIQNWLPDSGASSHMTPMRDELFDIELLPSPIGVFLGDGHEVQCIEKGKKRLHLMTTKGAQVDLILKDILVVPGLVQRLFSLHTFTDEHAISMA